MSGPDAEGFWEVKIIKRGYSILTPTCASAMAVLVDTTVSIIT